MARRITRRAFGAATGSAALGVLAANRPARARPLPAGSLQFPNGFVWGVATAAYQIEGAPDADGKGRSIWDVYSRTPGKIRNNDTGDVATDHYRRYREDVALMKDIGAQAYRFSISWPRIFPDGTGQPNPKGLDFYSRLVDELLAAGIVPWATLYHWDLPQALQDRVGGWQSRDTAHAFGDYAAYVARHLSDRVRNFFTLNEISVFAELGHRGHDGAEHAPGLRLGAAALNQVRHHAVLAHGLAVQAIRAYGRAGTKVGPAENISAAVPAIDTPADVRAAETATRDMNAQYLGVMLEGRYGESYLAAAGKDAPAFTDGDLRVIASPVDFVGINVYRPSVYVVASDVAPGYRVLPENASHPRMASSWHLLGPEVMYWAPRMLHALWGVKDIYITENGCGTKDVIAGDGSVSDPDRVMYLRNAMMHLQRACAEGVPVRGNFVWSLMDNFEWADGYERRFGIVYVDYATQKRIPKLSTAWFREAAARNAVV